MRAIFVRRHFLEKQEINPVESRRVLKLWSKLQGDHYRKMKNVKGITNNRALLGSLILGLIVLQKLIRVSGFSLLRWIQKISFRQIPLNVLILAASTLPLINKRIDNFMIS